MTFALESQEALDAPPRHFLATAYLGTASRSVLNAATAGLALALAISAFSYVAGGIPFMSDLAFFVATLMCLMVFVYEALSFGRNLGIGKIIFFGGVLVWFSQDYFESCSLLASKNVISAADDFSSAVIARAVFFHMLFIFSAAIGLRSRGIGFLARKIENLREPKDPSIYFKLIIASLIVGAAPNYILSTRNPFETTYLLFTNMRSGNSFLTVYREGNFNYSWMNYLLRLTDLGAVGGIFAIYCALFVFDSLPRKITCWLIWSYWILIGFGTGARGAVVASLVPAIFFVYLRYQTSAAKLLRKFSGHAYLYAGLLLAMGYVLVQVQITYRNSGLDNANLGDVDFHTPQGNKMFSESLTGFATVPDQVPYFYDRYPGEALLRTIPQELFFFAIHPIPRALWNSKPYDQAWAWYNRTVTGKGDGLEGTTISTGLVGHYYIRFGAIGVIQAALIFGLILATLETVLRETDLRPLSTLFCCGCGMVCFRTFRSFNPSEFWAFGVGMIAMLVLLRIFERMGGSNGVDPPLEAS